MSKPTPPLVSIIIPTWNSLRWLPDCLAAVQTQSYPHLEIIIVDNGSEDESVAYTKRTCPQARVIQFSENRGFAAAVNAGIRAAQGELIALLNVDTAAHPHWVSELVTALQASPASVGSAASQMRSMRNPALIDDAGDSFSVYGSARKRGLGQPAQRFSEADDVFSACAGAAMYRRTFFEQVGLFDEGFNSYLEDIDLGFRGQLQGYQCVYVPQAKVLHYGQGAGTVRPRYVYLMTRNRLRLLLKNMPGSLGRRYFWHLLYGQVYFFLVYKHPLTSLKAWADFLRHLPQTWAARRAIQAKQRVSAERIEAILSQSLGEPSLREIIKNRWAQVKGRGSTAV